MALKIMNWRIYDFSGYELRFVYFVDIDCYYKNLT